MIGCQHIADQSAASKNKNKLQIDRIFCQNPDFHKGPKIFVKVKYSIEKIGVNIAFPRIKIKTFFRETKTGQIQNKCQLTDVTDCEKLA